MDLNKVKELLMPYLEEHELTLYDVKFTKEFGYQVLQVFVDKTGGIDVDTLGLVNEYLSEKLDAIDGDMPEYMLEVSSPGAEKELRTSDEVLANVGSYVNVKTADMVYEGTLLSFEDNKLTLKINIKGRMKNVVVEYYKVKKIRLAIKF